MKSIKYSYGLKTVAFLVALACVFSAALYTQMVVQTFYSYGWQKGLTSDELTFTDSSLFQQEVVSTLDDLNRAYVQNNWERDQLPKYDTLEEEQDYVLTQFHQFQEEMLATYGGEVYVYSATGSSVRVEETTAYGSPTENIGSFANTFHLNSISSSEFTLYSDETDQEVLDTVAEVYNSTLENYKRQFESSVLQAQQALGKLKNVHYYLYNTNTGDAITNMPAGTTPEDFTGQFGQFQADDWYFGYTCDRGLTMYSDSLDIDTFYQSAYADPMVSILNSDFCDNGYDVYLDISMPLERGDSFADAQEEFLTGASQIRTRCLATIVLLVAAAALSLYLVLVTGHVRGREGICLAPGDKLPNDLHFVLSWGLGFAAGTGAVVACSYAIGPSTDEIFFPALGALLSAVVYAIAMEWINSVAKGYKAGRPYFRSTLLAKLFIAWHKGNKKLFGALRRIYFAKLNSLSKKVRWFAFFYLAVNAVLSLFTFERIGVALFLLILFNVISLILVWRYVISLDKIITAAQKSHDGEPAQLLDTQNMPQPLRSLAENFTAAQESKAAAIEEALKGERMKTELITNVSHDLKTPLTSIISYVDLLEKCDIQDETAQKYIRVLDEKSGRLKRLIEDLVEASKVSSGAVTLNKIRVNLCELATQAVGEMEDSFAEHRLEIVLNTPETPPVIFADSQKTWRIFDNLLNNARKYSLEGTRVYVDVREENGEGIFSVKNVSAEALNIPPEELTQRFVRGDQSRTKEGSGLGLSIAKDLCTLQGGALELQIDGDLFKATVKLPLAYDGDIAESVSPVSPDTPNA